MLHTIHGEVAEMDASIAFYEDVLGVTFTAKSPFWSQFSCGDVVIGLHPTYSKTPNVNGFVLGFRVDSIQAWIEKLDARGIPHADIDRLDDGTQMVSFHDLDGNRLQVIQPG